MNKGVEKVVNDIKALKIQGARNIAKSALHALVFSIRVSGARTATQLYHEMREHGEALALARPTEPMLRNTIDGMLKSASPNIRGAKTTKKAKADAIETIHELLKKIETDKQRLIEYGAKLVPDCARVITHCHSSTAVGILIRAQEMGKCISVVACETRPRYQGRITAKELAAAKIPVTLVVDGAMNHFMKKSEICIVGADAVTSRGDLINKVGTSTLAHIARFHDVSFYSAAELFKYSPSTMFGQLEKIEERDAKEILEKPIKGVTVRNPAFDATAARYISGYVTELGVIPPQSFFALATERLGIRLYE